MKKGREKEVYMLRGTLYDPRCWECDIPPKGQSPSMSCQVQLLIENVFKKLNLEDLLET